MQTRSHIMPYIDITESSQVQFPYSYICIYKWNEGAIQVSLLITTLTSLVEGTQESYWLQSSKQCLTQSHQLRAYQIFGHLVTTINSYHIASELLYSQAVGYTYKKILREEDYFVPLCIFTSCLKNVTRFAERVLSVHASIYKYLKILI